MSAREIVARGGMFVDGVAPVAERADATVRISGQRSFERIDRIIGAKPTGIPIASANTATKLRKGVRTIARSPRRTSTKDGRHADGLRDSPRRCPPTRGCS